MSLMSLLDPIVNLVIKKEKMLALFIDEGHKFSSVELRYYKGIARYKPFMLPAEEYFVKRKEGEPDVTNREGLKVFCYYRGNPEPIPWGSHEKHPVWSARELNAMGEARWAEELMSTSALKKLMLVIILLVITLGLSAISLGILTHVIKVKAAATT